jgi:hypothetical protein
MLQPRPVGILEVLLPLLPQQVLPVLSARQPAHQTCLDTLQVRSMQPLPETDG